MKFSFSLHSRVNITIDNKGLAPHSDIFLCNYLHYHRKIYINNFTIFLKSVIKSIFEFVNWYFFIQVIDIDCIIRTGLSVFVFYRLACITYLDRQNFIQTFFCLGFQFGTFIYYKQIKIFALIN
jgi:hypothetical protein